MWMTWLRWQPKEGVFHSSNRRDLPHSKGFCHLSSFIIFHTTPRSSNHWHSSPRKASPHQSLTVAIICVRHRETREVNGWPELRHIASSGGSYHMWHEKPLFGVRMLSLD
jgi:hypothetical protein